MISLPISVLPGATVLVQVGDKVTVGQTLAQKEGSKEHQVNVAELLHISPQKVADTLSKQPGDAVMKGDTLAVKRNALGITTAKLHSNIDGIIKSIDEETGILSITDQDPADPYVLICPIAGVVQVCNNNQIVIQTDQNVVQGFTGAGKSVKAKLHILPIVAQKGESNQQVLFDLNNSIVDRVIVGTVFNRDALVKAIGIGCVGIIATSLAEEDIRYLNEKNMLIPIIGVTADRLAKLTAHHDREVFLEGETGTILLLA